MIPRMNTLLPGVRLLAGLCACLVLLQVLAIGQSFTASLFGTTTDASGAAVPNVTLIATNTENNRKVEAVSDASGKYSIPGRQ